MALLQGTDYIRILKDGEFEIYNSQEERDLVKDAPDIQEILDKYRELLKEKREWFFNELRKDKEYTDFCSVVLQYDHYFLDMENLDDKGADEAYRRAHIINEKKAIEERRLYREMNRYMNSVENDDISYEEFRKMRFPFMIKHFPNIYLTKIRPKVIGKFDLLEGDNVDEAYSHIKKLGLLGQTKDI